MRILGTKQKTNLNTLAQQAAWTKMLDTCPIPNEAARLVHSDEEGAVYEIPLRRPGWYRAPISWFLPMRRFSKVFVYGAGREVLDLCDGERDVESIIEEFAERHDLTFHESRVSITQYFRSLVERGMLAVAILAPGGSTAQQ
jgi:hypothetical protein